MTLSMDVQEFKTAMGGISHITTEEVGSVLKVGMLLRPVDRVRLPFTSVRDKYGYPSLYFRKTSRRLSKEFRGFQQEIFDFKAAFESIQRNFSFLESSYDKSVVLPTTTGLSYCKPLHFDLDEKGEFGHKRKFLFPVDLLDFIATKYHRMIANQSAPVSLSLKRGTNLGWPTQKSNSNRLERDVLLSMHVALALGFKSQGARLKDVTGFLTGYHGEPFAVAGERLQHTDRVLPFFSNGAEGYVLHSQPRVRGIYFSPKYCVAWNRSYVKRYLAAMMQDPLHMQDRSALKRWFTSYNKKGYSTVSVDVSRFDQSVGGSAGRQILKVIAAALSGSSSVDGLNQAGRDIYEDLDHEFSMPCLIRTSGDLYISRGAEILSSGLSATSLIGTTYSECIVWTFATQIFGSLEKARSAYNEHRWSALTWGDDVVFSVQNSAFPYLSSKTGKLIASLDSALDDLGQLLELEFTQEPTLKFLGQNYDMLDYSDAATDYPLGRFIQQQFFPEREKKDEVAIIGFLARLKLLHPDLQEEVFRRTMDSYVNARLPYRWPYDHSDSLLKSCVEAVARDASTITQADDVLNIFTHGLEADDLLDNDVFPDLNEEFLMLLSASTVDLSDPIKFLKETAEFKDTRILSEIDALRRGQSIAWYRALSLVQRHFGGSLGAHDSYY